jgi:hypothetical protein
MKVKLDPIVKETMKFSPTLPAKSNGNTAQRKEWIDQVQKTSLREELEVYNETNVDYYCDTIYNGPQHDSENSLTDNSRSQRADVNYMYDRTVNSEICKDGYLFEPLDSLEQEYTDQHRTIFYDTVTREDKETGKSVTGFLERGNFLDRI